MPKRRNILIYIHPQIFTWNQLVLEENRQLHEFYRLQTCNMSEYQINSRNICHEKPSELMSCTCKPKHRWFHEISKISIRFWLISTHAVFSKWGKFSSIWRKTIRKVIAEIDTCESKEMFVSKSVNSLIFREQNNALFH